ncbi:MAG: hypothetical protein GW886_10590 [Rhodobacterales bacterium]|nr:hypothetical protein [Rhodobacterales bacterium]NCT12378.1 hypothetical protein [Rhodobacterales bacterium]
MNIAFHLGALCTDDERLHRALLKDAEQLALAGISVPWPSRYRRLLRETVGNLAGAAPSPDTREILLDAIIEDHSAKRLVLSDPAFLSLPGYLFDAGRFYGHATARLHGLHSIFPEDRITLFLGLRNPATFVPAVWSQVRGRRFSGFMGEIDPRDLRWSDVIAQIRIAAPQMALTVWCNEDTPLIWTEVLRAIAGSGAEMALAGEHDLLAAIMSPEGLVRFQKYLQTHPPQTEAQTRRIISAFLDKYALPEAIEEEVDLPGWDSALIEEMTATYEDDVAMIAAQPGLTFIAP